MASAAHEQRRRRRRFGRWLRLVLVVLTFALGVQANRALGLDGPSAAYAALQAFALGLDVPPDPARMAEGGWAVPAVWLTRFAAPVIVAESIVFLALLGGLVGRPRLFLVDHVVVIGAGPLGRVIAAQLVRAAHAHGEHLEVVVVERSEAGRHLDPLRQAGVWVETGDPTAAGTLQRVRADRARAVIVVTGDDVLDVAVTLALVGTTTPRPEPWIFVQVVRDRHLHDSARAWIGTDRHDVELFSIFDEAAAGLAEGCGARAVVVGFGRLGHAVLRHLGSRPTLLVDKEAIADGEGRRTYRGAIEDEATVDAIVAFAQEGGGVETTVYVCTDDDLRNLDVALQLDRRLRTREGSIRLVTRMLHPPPGAAAALERVGACDLSDLVGRRFGELATRAGRADTEQGPATRLVRAFARFSRGIGIT